MMNSLAYRRGSARPNVLLCIAGNPNDEAVTMEISLSGFEGSQGGRVFQRTETLSRGWNILEIPVDDISGIIDLKRLFRISLVPLVETPTLLQFLYAGFVVQAGKAGGGREKIEDRRWRTRETGRRAKSGREEKRIKLLVMDLDNTLWDGILIEHPDAEVELRPGIREVLDKLDQRGILLSVASKNNYDDIRQTLTRLGIWDLFLYPQVNWEPKSVNIRKTVQQLNIGTDTVAFIDDSEFERAEVEASLPEVRTFDASAFTGLLSLEEFSVPATEESRRRRRLYRDESERGREFSGSDLDYDAFLESCDIRLILGPFDAGNRERIFELVQRTNQLNFSGNRYSRDDLERMMNERSVVPVVARCEDRFGDYGIVGFAVLRLSGEGLELTDLMFSCRIQGKKIEHSFLAHVIAEAGASRISKFRCRFHPASRNAHAAKVFDDIGFVKQATPDSEGVDTYTFPCTGAGLPVFPARIVDELNIRSRLAASGSFEDRD